MMSESLASDVTRYHLILDCYKRAPGWYFFCVSAFPLIYLSHKCLFITSHLKVLKCIRGFLP